MEDNELPDQERIARELGWQSFDAAPRPVQRNIESREIEIEQPFALLEDA